jgi:hypothetical protein
MTININDIKISLYSVKLNGEERAKISNIPMPDQDTFEIYHRRPVG